MAARVLIVDDHPAVRRALRTLLEQRGYEVVGEAGCPVSAVDRATQLLPDAVLLDVHLPGRTGFEVAAQLTARQPAPVVLLTSTEWDPDFYARAEASGAAGFVPKQQLAQTDLRRFWSRANRDCTPAAAPAPVSVRAA